MSGRTLVVTGTDTGVGKTVFSAALAGALGATYWKPVQAGLDEETDSQAVQRLAGVRVLPERWRLRTPASPHFAAELDGVQIDPETLDLPELGDDLVVEGAGGVLVPLSRRKLYADLFVRWGAPVILCARTALGGINHALLTLEALKARGAPLLGIAFIGDPAPDTERTVTDFSDVKVLGRLPRIAPLTSDSLRAAFADNFDLRDFRG